MKNPYILAIIAAGAISVSAITSLGYSINSIYSSFNKMHKSLDRIYNCFAVDLPKVGKDVRELKELVSKTDACAARIEGDLEQFGNQADGNFKKLIQKLDSL
jgi:hypothetical protein